MPCTPLTVPSLPAALPNPLGLPTPSLEAPDPSYSPCCKLPPLPTPKVPIPYPGGVINPALITTMRAYTLQIRQFLDALPLSCPRE